MSEMTEEVRRKKVENESCFTVGVVSVTNLHRMAESTIYGSLFLSETATYMKHKIPVELHRLQLSWF